MSFGSQGETAFRAYAEAAYQADMLCMNGEGGEIHDMYGKYPKHRGQQIASGRFGVSSLLINSSEWVEIKIGQGAKPGEGGHLPGSKVTQAIAAARNAQVGSDLISPSNNHDLYSIEDLAQLIDELKTSNPHAKVIVKVPVVPGIGTIAIGIAKAGADVITMSGYDGGTGAARQHALRRAGLPCEIGTVLAHHALTEAGIRDRVEIWADGGLRSGADAIKLICMGANRLGFGTASMVAIGCTICRGCQLDTCHVGIATQLDEHEAHERGLKRFVPRVFDPSVETLVRYFTEMGEAMREIAGQMGVSEVQELVGQADRLVQVSHHDRLDLTSLLTPVRESIITAPAGTPRFFRPFHPPPPHRAPEVAAERLAAGAALAVEEESTTAADRNLGTDLAGLIARATTGVNNAWVNGDRGHAGNGVDGRRRQRRRRRAGQRRRQRQRRGQRAPPDAGRPRLHQGRGGRQRPGGVHPRGRAHPGVRRRAGRRRQVRPRRRDPGDEGAERRAASGSAATWARASPTAPSAASSSSRGTPTPGPASASPAPTWCSAASPRRRSTTASARSRRAPTARASRSST